jgi:Na+/citrate or Na+/malate symporter
VTDLVALRQSYEWRGRKSGVDGLTLFGLFAVTAMVVCYTMENHSPWFVLGFAVSCVLGSVYGFLQGAWPFGLVEAVWSVIAAHNWWTVSLTISK